MTEMIKGKRTKRQRPVSPLSLAITSSSSNGGDQESVDERERISNNMVSASSSSEFTECVREEEDMANCLILMANGHQTLKSLEPSLTTSNTKVSGLCAYECKTCNRRFPSFQALGGHRASHKKPNKLNDQEKKPVANSVMEQEEDQFNAMGTILSLHIPNRVVCNNSTTNAVKSNKVHECSICGAEFSSGQALGGHMRRHRVFATTSTTPSTTTTTTASLVTSSPESQESKRPRNSLELDLNLPAPEDHDLQGNNFRLASKEQVLVFSMSSLVDCHY